MHVLWRVWGRLIGGGLRLLSPCDAWGRDRRCWWYLAICRDWLIWNRLNHGWLNWHWLNREWLNCDGLNRDRLDFDWRHRDWLERDWLNHLRRIVGDLHWLLALDGPLSFTSPAICLIELVGTWRADGVWRGRLISVSGGAGVRV